ncbi:MAG TPA: VOC family protein [Solirubrobacteraceae bacterium]
MRPGDGSASPRGTEWPNGTGRWPRLIPELQVVSLDASLRFYEDAGFAVAYARPEEAFVMLVRDGAALMLEEISGPGRRLGADSLERPLGRGMNLQVQVTDVADLHDRMAARGWTVVVVLEERWYRVDDREAGNHQFVAADPDGYLLRFFEDLGTRDAVAPA